MKSDQELYDETLFLLSKARKMMRCLMNFCGDWTARTQVESCFDHVEQECTEFGKYQLGLTSTTPDGQQDDAATTPYYERKKT